MAEIFKWGFLEAVILKVRGGESKKEGYSRDGFQQAEDSEYLGEDYVFRGDETPTVTSYYSCETERVVEAVTHSRTHPCLQKTQS